ncbi:hypothetical protein [Spirosoma pollinicola]|uniref:Uncharacterized protein n=1 Tax=Spirosoma pollinicola TaxID=2057025 RepID=A0A2K8YTM0_9BACT|nr:hypothetical protein [Spirosoma pollinicola]AUD00970.1 hypothetical protein CWM47_03535 [Spirosoma pollinicola]
MIFSSIKTLDQFEAEISTIDDWMDLNEVRITVLAWNKRQSPHPLMDNSFQAVLDALDKRAESLGFMVYSFGYRKPATPKQP